MSDINSVHHAVDYAVNYAVNRSVKTVLGVHLNDGVFQVFHE